MDNLRSMISAVAETLHVPAMVNKLNSLSRRTKVGLVLGGYAAAFCLALGADWFITSFEPHDVSQGMQAGGDLLRFIGLWAAASILPTALALFFLRAFQKFWTVFSMGSLVLAAFGVVSVASMTGKHGSFIAGLILGLFGLLIVLGAPVLGVGFLAFAWIAPRGHSRWRLIAAAAIEFGVCAYALICYGLIGHWLG